MSWREFWVALTGGFLGAGAIAVGVYLRRNTLPRLDHAKPYSQAHAITAWLKRERGGR